MLSLHVVPEYYFQTSEGGIALFISLKEMKPAQTPFSPEDQGSVMDPGFLIYTPRDGKSTSSHYSVEGILML